MSTYPVGHHESVLRSHRWRTAPNSAGYLGPPRRYTPSDRPMISFITSVVPP
jgi:hypothetical protein